MVLRLSVLLLIVSNAMGQDFLSQVRKNLEIDQRRNPIEKVYLHLDRPFYMTGETIHFGAFVTEGYQHTPTTISNNVHVELHSPENKLVQRFTIQCLKGGGSGYIDLADSMRSGIYTIRAYTSWMQNFDNSFIFQRSIRIYSLVENQQFHSILTPQSKFIDLQFLPEGGSWVYGIETRIAFKAINEKGLGIDVKGRIFDDLNREVITFRSTHLGMGAVSMAPQQGRSYYAKVEGSDTPFHIPQPTIAGFVLSVRSTQKNVQFQIRSAVSDANNHVTLVVQCRGRVIYSTNAIIGSGELNGVIPRAAFLTGVNHITLFDKNQRPVAERLFYVEREDPLAIVASLQDSVTGKRKRVAMDIEIRDSEGKPIKAHLSISATDNSQVILPPNRETICSYLLMRSDLKGTIEDPGYYFNSVNRDRFEALDLLLLTQGWRRFTWDRILQNAPVKISYPAEKGFHIAGIMKRNYSNKVIPNGKVSFLSKDFKTIFGAVETNASGRFRVDDIQVEGPTEMLFQGHFKNEKRTDVWIDFDTLQVVAEPDKGTNSPPEDIGEFERAFINKGILRRNIDERFDAEKGVTLLEDVVIMGQKIPTTIREKLVAEGRGYRRTITIDNTSWATHPFQLLRGKATGIGDCPGRPIRVYWDGMEIFHPSQLTSKDPNMVSEIDTACDLIAFWTRRGSYSNSAMSFILRGYQPKREFYAPKYHQQLPEYAKEDYRVTLAFQPNIQTNDQGQAHFEFYTSDLVTTITISAEGLTQKGTPFVFQRSVKVSQ